MLRGVLFDHSFHHFSINSTIICSSCCNLRGEPYHKKIFLSNMEFSRRQLGRRQHDDVEQ